MPPLHNINIVVYALVACTWGLEISTPEQLVDFAIAVNSGTDYELTKVFLTQDIDMAGYMNNFVPIGTSFSYTFKGYFNGNSHIISNLVYSASTESYLSLFGYTESARISNLVLDTTCSSASSLNSATIYASGVKSGPGSKAKSQLDASSMNAFLSMLAVSAVLCFM